MRVLHIDPTPNPDALKFNVDGLLIPRGWRSFDDARAAADDPLAWAVFETGKVRSVFVTPTFVTVTIAPEEDWWTIKPKILAAIEAYEPEPDAGDERSGEAGASGGSRMAAPAAAASEQDERLDRILELLESRVGPALAGDGGGLEVLGLDGDELRIRYQGACGSCPSAITGTLRAIQELVRIEIDPRIRVVAA